MRAGWFVAALVIGLLTGALTASANGMPLAAKAEAAGGVLRPAERTPIAVVREQLLLDLRDYQARVRASYQLQNQSPESVAVSVAFPVPHISGEALLRSARPEIRLDGQPLGVELSLGPAALEAGDTAVRSEWLDPFTGEEYQPEPAWGPTLPSAFLLFPVFLEAGQERHLEVEYRQRPGWDYTRFLEESLRYDYLLRPARHWSTFGELQIEVLAPPGRVVRGVPSLMPAGTGRYVARFNGLPDSNLSVFVSPGGGWGRLSSWWWRRAGRAWMLVTLTGVGSFAAGWLRRSAPSRWRHLGTVLGLATPLAVLAMTPQALFEPNPIGVMKTWFLFAPGLIGVYFVGDRLSRRLGRHLEG